MFNTEKYITIIKFMHLMTSQICEAKLSELKGEIEKSTRRVFNKFSLAIVIEQVAK